MLIDTHTHVHFNAFKDDSEAVVKRALAENIWMITVGTQKDTSRFAVDMAEKFEGVFAAVGLHPIHTHGGIEEKFSDQSELSFKSRHEEFDETFYEKLISSSKKVVAIGECGLDYYRIPHQHIEAAKANQRRSFSKQIAFADRMDLPIIIHCRDAHDDVIRLLDQELSAGRLKRRGVIHCFTSDYNHAVKYSDLGFLISFSGIVTFSPDLGQIAKRLPLNKILLETDAPYLTPVPFRGKRNEPLYVRHTAEHLAKLLGLRFEELAEVTTNNAKRLFRI